MALLSVSRYSCAGCISAVCKTVMCIRYPGESEQLLCQTLLLPHFLQIIIMFFFVAIISLLLQEPIKSSTDIVYISYEFV